VTALSIYSLCSLLSSSSSKKFISWNDGADDIGCGWVSGIKSSSVSKSGGRGKSLLKSVCAAFAVSAVFGYTFGVTLQTLQIGATIGVGRPRARINTPRISAGYLSCSSFVGMSGTDSFSVSDFGSASGSVFCFVKILSVIFVINFGIGIVINGLPVRATIMVVAIYNGIAAKIIMQNVNPPKPCKCACNTCIQWARLNKLKSNKAYNNVQIVNTYQKVHIIGARNFCKKSVIFDMLLL